MKENKNPYDENGELHGECRFYYNSGVLESLLEFKHGVLNGLCKEWATNGELTFEGNYVNGEQDGIYYIYYDNGNLWEIGRTINGVLNGLVTFFDLYGNPIINIIFFNGMELYKTNRDKLII